MKILIVDDEEAIHEQLKACIPAQQLGWEIVGDAYHGEEACLMVEQYLPDIVITDIKMPLLDGLSFMEWMKRGQFTGKVIVLSGYGDFQYSRPAFLLDAFDYLLKPLQEVELIRTLSRAVEQLALDSNRRIEQINEKAVLNQGIVLMRDELLSQIVAGRIKDEIDIFVRAEQLYLALPEYKYHTLVIHLIDLDEHIQDRYRGDRSIFYFAARNILEEILQEQGGTVFRNLHKSNEFVAVCEAKGTFYDVMKWARRIHLSLTTCLRVRALIGISVQKQRIDALTTAYFEGVHAMETIRFGTQETIVRYGEEPDKAGQVESREWKELQVLLECLVDTGTIDSEAGLLRKLEEALHQQAMATMSLQDFKQAATLLVDKIAHASHRSEQIPLWLQEARTGVQELKVNQVQRLLRSIMDQLLKSVTNNHKMKSGKQLIYSIKQYVEDNYQSVNLESIARHFYLNKNYFCSMFKSVTGENFSDYLTKVRMDQAKLLLASSGLTSYEIAERVGYQDQRYFSKVFRKTTGLLPKQYRAQLHNDI
ncbi:two-component system response regulator YesN [Paenibacillus sp. V4I9]|uniref:response regulator n=1 Tax=Paenibacillus sp. V4I9 TaxID=3042308 RepID=UPI00277D6C6B|nr:response regulator [Paenibacillus sp. V4I9]MDQ0885589.1 two-component system response regulator YesN [Paenibacillus sp. V4I9]